MATGHQMRNLAPVHDTLWSIWLGHSLPDNSHNNKQDATERARGEERELRVRQCEKEGERETMGVGQYLQVVQLYKLRRAHCRVDMPQKDDNWTMSMFARCRLAPPLCWAGAGAGAATGAG